MLQPDGLEQGRTYVAERAGSVVGFASWVKTAETVDLEDLFVEPTWMRKGVASQKRRMCCAWLACCSPGGRRRVEAWMARWDFCANVDELVALSADGRGPRSMSAMLSAAEQVVARLRAEDPAALQRWLDDNANLLIAQQVLAMSVHAQHATSDEMSALLREWVLSRTSTEADGQSAVAWLREQHPAQLRAWLLSQVDRLIDSEITQLGIE